MTTRRGLRASARKVERATGRLTSAAVARMGDELAWFRDLPAEHRAWVGTVAHAGIGALVEWLRRPSADDLAGTVFGAAPRELARSVTLGQAVELVRVTVDVVEQRVGELAAPGEADAVREAVLRFSREVAFAAAQVYAAAAEERGAWHARQRALLVESLVRADPPDVVRARAGALGWPSAVAVVAVAGAAPPGDQEHVLDTVERSCRAPGLDVVPGLHGGTLVVLAGAPSADLARQLPAVCGGFGAGPVVVGPIVADLDSAARSVRAALAGLRAARAVPALTGRVAAADLLPERALDGDADAADALVEDVYKSLVAAGEPVVETVATFVEHGGSVEATARALFLHPNTVRYRLRKAVEVTGVALTEPRGLFVARVALVLARLRG